MIYRIRLFVVVHVFAQFLCERTHLLQPLVALGLGIEVAKPLAALSDKPLPRKHHPRKHVHEILCLGGCNVNRHLRDWSHFEA